MLSLKPGKPVYVKGKIKDDVNKYKKSLSRTALVELIAQNLESAPCASKEQQYLINELARKLNVELKNKTLNNLIKKSKVMAERNRLNPIQRYNELLRALSFFKSHAYKMEQSLFDYLQQKGVDLNKFNGWVLDNPNVVYTEHRIIFPFYKKRLLLPSKRHKVCIDTDEFLEWGKDSIFSE